MKLKVEHEILKIQTVVHDYWRPNGYSKNTVQIKIDNDWYDCNLRIIKENNKNKIEIECPFIVNKTTNVIERFYCNGVYCQIEISSIKKMWINYLLNKPSLRYRFTYIKNRLHERINVIIIFSIAFLLTIAFFKINKNHNNELIDYISKNIWCQSIIIFLTISSFINIFYPFTLRKEINKKDIKNISSKITDEKFKEKEQEANRNKTATI